MNEVRTASASGERTRLEVEVQSGDVIEVEASLVTLEAIG